MLCIAFMVWMVCGGRLLNSHIITVVFVAAWHNQSQKVETEYECKEFHKGKCMEKIVGIEEFCRVAVVRLGKIKCGVFVFGLWVAKHLFNCEG